MGNLHWRRVLAGPVALGGEEPMLEQFCWQGLWRSGAVCSWRTTPCGKGPTLQQLMKSCSLWEGPTLEKFMEVHRFSYGRHPTPEEGKSVRSPPPAEEGEAQTSGMNCSLHFLYLCTTGREKVDRIEIKIKPRKKRGLWRRCLTI